MPDTSSRNGLIPRLTDWLDDRAGVRDLVNDALYESVPGGARWRYVWGSTLVMAFMTQVVTGIFLWMAYSPSTQTAWESVYYIQHEMTGGWLLRGIHHFMAQAMIILLAIHFLQVVWDGAYRAPRELNFVLGLILMLIVLGLALTGYLLPWDQKGYWATNVGTELSSLAPGVGSEVKQLAVGGSSYGHHTLTRFFALHAGVLPGAMVAFLALHIALFRRHGLHAKDKNYAPDSTFWPDQVLKDSVAALGVLAAVLGLTVYYGGAELTAPADPASPYNAARPEWYFLFLFQFLKWFPGQLEIWGAIVIPTVVLIVLFLMPWIGKSKAGHFFNVGLLVVIIGGAVALTVQAINDDYYASGFTEEEATALLDSADDADNLAKTRYEASRNFLDAKDQAHNEAHRVIELASSPSKTPPTGALPLVQNDPYLQGPKLYKQNCASCHNYQDLRKELTELPSYERALVNEEPTAPNLYGVGSRDWIAKMLDPKFVNSKHYFGYKDSPFGTDGDYPEMVDYITACFADLEGEERKAVEEAFDKVAIALSAEAKLPSQVEADKQDAKLIQQGRALIEGKLADIVSEGMSCTDCHTFGEQQDIGSPVLDGYMSKKWLSDLIRNPADERFYGDMNDRMPKFAPHDNAMLNQLDDKSLELIVDWLRQDWYRPEKTE
ncbi:cytochrome b [Adhaeretor mobilis]|uniref:Menaquinol-cytochrome c reductase cytochrome b subunit n=1 Tax=Adhaeretor mobilis TaxID=1930276 RepID=A0A517N063_9BACT|nr:cytochrome b N-terminal domain-containing protein [Adhaeretor mobilis]QDT00527.1 Menaquinol-cytochrome c reductase cytochrome b subunit [Adhaeretor mobilis]